MMIRKHKFILLVATACVVVAGGVLIYWWISQRKDGSADMPLPQWLRLPTDASVLISQGPQHTDMLHEGPVQYIRVRFVKRSAESSRATLDGLLQKWHPSGGKPEWRPVRDDLWRRQDRPDWLRSLMLPDGRSAGGYYAQLSDGATTYIEIVVAPDGSDAIAEIVISNML